MRMHMLLPACLIACLCSGEVANGSRAVEGRQGGRKQLASSLDTGGATRPCPPLPLCRPPHHHQTPTHQLSKQAHESVTAQETVAAWEEERRVSKYADTIEQLDTGRKISANPKDWRCDDTGATENLWLNLSTGHIGSGRRVRCTRQQAGSRGPRSGQAAWPCCMLFPQPHASAQLTAHRDCPSLSLSLSLSLSHARASARPLPCTELGRQRRQRLGAAPLRGDRQQVPARRQARHDHAVGCGWLDVGLAGLKARRPGARFAAAAAISTSNVHCLLTLD